MKQIMIATGNKNKVREFKEMLEPLGYEVLSMKDWPEPIEIIENGKTFAENSVIKSETVSKVTNGIVIADDSGLEVDALNKEPGVYSARYLGEDTPYSYKNRVILERMEGKTERSARFVCAISIAQPHEETRVFVGVMEGEVAHEIAGENGFGYDPIFWLPQYGCTSAQLTPDEKNAISHRGKALRMLLDYLNEKAD